MMSFGLWVSYRKFHSFFVREPLNNSRALFKGLALFGVSLVKANFLCKAQLDLKQEYQ